MKQLGIITLLFTVFSVSLAAQCVTWNDLANKAEIEEAHVLYRDFFKQKNYKEAFSYWQTAFNAAPAADGKRDLHYSNGVDIYLDQFKNEADATKKEELKKTILDMYDQWVACIEAGTITLANTDMKKHVGYIRGREAFNMFYTLNVPYEDNIATLNNAIEVAGNDTEYIILDPYARIVQYQFTNELMDKETARGVYIELNEIADYNIANNKQFSSYYQQAKESMNAVFATIENYIFDCDYFKNKLLPDYEADPNNGELVKNIYNTLIQQGCDKEDPKMMELESKYQVYADAIRDSLLQERYKLYPGDHARDLYKEGKYPEAIKKWTEAIEKAEEDDKKAEYNYWIGYTKFHKQNETSGALSYARKGVSSSELGGKALMLIGDAYAKISRNCGKPEWDARLVILAAIDKYAAAKAKDPSISSEASRKIGNYSAFKPSTEEAFSRSKKAGDKVKAPCVGETVTLRLSKG